MSPKCLRMKRYLQICLENGSNKHHLSNENVVFKINVRNGYHAVVKSSSFWLKFCHLWEKCTVNVEWLLSSNQRNQLKNFVDISSTDVCIANISKCILVWDGRQTVTAFLPSRARISHRKLPIFEKRCTVGLSYTFFSRSICHPFVNTHLRLCKVECFKPLLVLW